MYRKIERTLQEWKDTKGRKPLLITGARQTGKTYIIKKFGGSAFRSVIFIDFEKNPKSRTLFDTSLNPDDIIPLLEAVTNTRYIEGETLVVFDEIQSCPKAITSLKYFSESSRDFHIIGAGSLLGVALKRQDFSFPVGKVRTERLYPMDFEEFLMACGKDSILSMCNDAFLSKKPLPAVIHEELLSLYRSYLIVGGMPDSVSAYLEDGSYLASEIVKADILSDYRSDIAKYADDSEKILAQRAFDTLPIQLAKENKKFQYNLIRKGATSALFGKSLEWLCAAGLSLKCGKVTIPDIPLKAYEDLSSFKLYLLDPGLLVQMAELPKEIILNQLGERFMGGLTENYVASALSANGYPLFYWESEGKAEIDFLIQAGTEVVPIEVKASSHVRSRSLSVYREKFRPRLSLRLSTRNFGMENGIFSIPLYAAYLIRKENLPIFF